MGIRGILDNLVTLEEGLSIASPAALNTLTAWKFMPPGNAEPEPPCWFNTFTFTGEDRRVNLRRLYYTITVQFLAGDANSEQDHRADIAAAFHEALIVALDADLTLGGTCSNHERRGHDPTLVVVQYGGKGYIGLEEYVDVVIVSAATFAGGN